VETNVWLNRDIREPNFLVLGDQNGQPAAVRLYFIENGRTLTTFETGSSYYLEKRAGGTWSAPVKLSSAGDDTYVPWGEGYVIWRVKTVTHPAHNGGRPTHYMLRYKGSHYGFTNPDGTPNTDPDITIEFLTSSNGTDWSPVRDRYSADRSGTWPSCRRRLDRDCPRRLREWSRSLQAIFPEMRRLDWLDRSFAPASWARLSE